MADEAEKPKPQAPHGAQIMRSLRRSLKAAMDESTSAASSLDECEAKSVIGGVVSGIGEHLGGLEKAWAKHYKDHDIDAEGMAPEDDEIKSDEPEEKPAEKPAEGESELSDDDIDAALAALDDDAPEKGEPEKPKPTEKSDTADDEDDEDDLTPEQKRQVESRIKRLERLAAR